MKSTFAFAIVTLGCCTHAFVAPAARTAVRPQTSRAAEKINTIEFELDKPKVRMEKLTAVMPSRVAAT